MARSRIASVVVIATTAACFADPPPLDDATTGSTSGVTSTAESGSTSASNGADSTTTAADTTGSPANSDSEADSGSTTGGEAACMCPPSSIVCEGFEMGLADWPNASGEPVAIVQRPPLCEGHVLSAKVPAGSNLAIVTLHRDPPNPVSTGSWSVGGFVRVSSGCLGSADVRILRLLFDVDGGTPEYWFDVIVNMMDTRLVVGDAVNTATPGVAGTIAVDEWVELDLTFDLTTTYASADLVPGGEAGVGNAPAAGDLTGTTMYLMIGPDLLAGQTLPNDCVVLYDQIRIASAE